jgi:large subunit ribosomal protein L15
MPLQRRLPKRGFTNIFKVAYQIVNVGELNSFESQTVVTPSVLQEAGKIKSLKKPVKILGQGDLSVSLTVKVDKFSRVARQKIVGAGGNVVEEGPA